MENHKIIREKTVQRFIAFLKERKKNVSSERLIVLNTILNHQQQHFTANKVVDQLASGPQSVSRATVFRTLVMLEEAEIIKSMPEKLHQQIQAHYELLILPHEHGHLICQHCGRIIEFNCTAVADLHDKICRKYNFIPKKKVQQIYGLCQVCAANNNGQLSKTG